MRLALSLWHGPPGPSQSLQSEWHITLARWLAIAGVLVGLPWLGLAGQQLLFVVLVVGAGALFNLTVQWAVLRRPEVLASGYLTALGDTLLSLAMITVMGGFDSPFTSVFFPVTSAIAVRAGYRPALAVVALVIAADGLSHLFGPETMRGAFAIRSIFLCLTALLSSYLAAMVQRETRAKTTIVAARSIAESARRREAFLAETSRRLADSLDLDTTLREITQFAAAPGFADYCRVRLVADNRSIDQVAVAADLDPSHDNLMIVPLVGRGRTLGAIAFVRTTSEMPYDAADLVLAEDLARRCAQAIDNAQLYQAAQFEVIQRRKAEDALRESEQFVTQVIATAGEGVIAYDRDLHIVVWNRFMEQLTGMPAEKVLGRCAPDVFPHLFAKGMLDPAQRALAGETVEAERTLLLPNGHTVWSIGTYAPHRNALDEIVGVVAIVRDTTAHRQAALALRKSEERYKQFVDHAMDIVYQTDANGRFVFVNPVVESTLGYLPEELLGRSYPFLIALQDRQRVAEFYRQQLAERTLTTHCDFLVLAKDGTEHWIEQTVQLVVDDGQIEGCRAIARDVTHRKRSEGERARLMGIIEHERATLAAINSSMSDGLILLGAHGRIAYVNGSAGRLLGADADQLHGKSVATVVAAALDQQDSADTWAAFQDGLARLDSRPHFFLALSGPPRRDVHVQLFPVVGSPDEPAGAGVLLRDVTAERELRRTKDELFSMVSHELASPATSLVTHAELLAANDYSVAERQEILGTIVREGRRLNAIVRDFLDVQRLELHGLTTILRPTDIHGLLKHAATVAASDQDHPLVVDVPESLPLVQADPDRVQQVIANLLSNARKYTLAGGEIRLTARGVDGAIEVSVADQGLGVPAEALPHVFEKFYRVAGNDRAAIRGTGLGLAIVKELVEAQGGHIGAESAGRGQGSRFWFTLPLAGQAAMVQSAPASVVITPSRGLRILAVDDDPAIGAVVRRVLRPDGHQVTIANSAEEALARLRNRPFDVVLSDVGLGRGMDGWQLADTVRRQWPAIRFVLSSGLGGIDLIEAHARGVDDLLPKPYSAADLRRILNDTSFEPRAAA